MSRVDDRLMVAMSKGQEQYAVLFTPDSRREALRVLGRWAGSQELNFSWEDAAAMSQKIREGCKAT